MSEVATLITAIAAFIASSATLISVFINSRHIKEVKHEVKTGNSQTLAQLADARETRRIDDIQPDDRTDLENAHITEIGQEE
jgi:hypothetical protein